jgi:hypothetical protein
MRSGLPCGKRLKQALPHWLKHYEKHYGALSSECREKLFRISPATLDRLLNPCKARHRRKLNTRNTSENQIPVRTSNKDIDRPGRRRSAPCAIACKAAADG